MSGCESAEPGGKGRTGSRVGRVLLHTGGADGPCSRACYAISDAAGAALLAPGVDAGETDEGVLNAFSDRQVKSGPLP